jgi:hypothetical protein
MLVLLEQFGKDNKLEFLIVFQIKLHSTMKILKYQTYKSRFITNIQDIVPTIKKI